MKINICDKAQTFKEVQSGEFFMLDNSNTLFLKINTLMDRTLAVNAIDIVLGCGCAISEDTKIIKPDVTINAYR